MNYEVIEIANIDGDVSEYIKVATGENSYTTFLATTDEPAFISFLQQAQKENDPYYTEWVEAGNDPDEFWTQDAL